MNAYLNVSAFIAWFPDYFGHMMNHLISEKLQHWEHPIRKLAGQSLSVICPANPTLSIEKGLKPLIQRCFDKALHKRHGAVIGVGELLIGLSGNSYLNRKEALERAHKTLSLAERKLISQSDNRQAFQKKYDEESSIDYLKTHLDAETLTLIKGIVKRVEKERLYRGMGGEIMRAGVCHLISSMCIAKIEFSTDEILYLFSQLKENLKHPNLEI